MNIAFLFAGKGDEEKAVLRKRIAQITSVHLSTAWRWSEGAPVESFQDVAQLYAHGLLTDEDLRAAGLAIPRQPGGEAA